MANNLMNFCFLLFLIIFNPFYNDEFKESDFVNEDSKIINGKKILNAKKIANHFYQKFTNKNEKQLADIPRIMDGTTFAFCLTEFSDSIRHVFFSNQVTTEIVSGLISELTTLHTETTFERAKIKPVLTSSELRSDEHVNRLQSRTDKLSITKNDENLAQPTVESNALLITKENEVGRLIEQLNFKGVTVKFISFKQIAEWLSKAGLDINITGIEFFKLLISQNLINENTYNNLIEYLDSNGISINQDAQTIIEFLDSKGIVLELTGSTLLEFLVTHNLFTKDFAKSLRDYLDSIGISREIISSFLSKGLEYKELKKEKELRSLRGDTKNLKLVTELSTLSPTLILYKAVNKEKAFIGQNLKYEINVGNNGNYRVKETFVVDIIPARTSLIESSVTSHGLKGEIKVLHLKNNYTIIMWHIKEPLLSGNKDEFPCSLVFHVKIN